MWTSRRLCCGAVKTLKAKKTALWVTCLIKCTCDGTVSKPNHEINLQLWNFNPAQTLFQLWNFVCDLEIKKSVSVSWRFQVWSADFWQGPDVFFGDAAAAALYNRHIALCFIFFLMANSLQSTFHIGLRWRSSNRSSKPAAQQKWRSVWNTLSCRVDRSWTKLPL